jgi:hypothetical protein
VEETSSARELDVLRELCASSDPYLRAAAVWAASAYVGDAEPRSLIEQARQDEHALVRETAALFAEGGLATASDAGGQGRPGPPTRPLSTIETMHLLHAVPLFSGLDPEDLHELALYAVEEIIAPPDVIFEQGDVNADALFVVLGGRATVHRHDGADAGAALRRETLGPGAVFGELSVLDGTRRDVTVRPDGGPVRVLRIPGPSFRGGLLRRTRVTEWLLAALAGRIRRLADTVERR